MDFWSLVFEIVCLLGVAMALGVLAERLKQNSIIGSLLAGILLGPSALGLVQSVEAVRVLAELGVAMLLYSIGLEFSWSKLKQFGVMALVGGAAQIVLTAAAAGAIGAMLGQPAATSLVVGFALALSSTAIVLKILNERAEIDSAHGRLSLGILLVQDVAVVPLMILISVLSARGASDGLQQLQWSIVKLIVLVVALYALVRWVISPVARRALSPSNREFPPVLAVTVLLGCTWLAHWMGLSPALGAFAAGVILGDQIFADQIRADIGPLRAVFVTLFFTSIGMLASLPKGDILWLLPVGVAVVIVLNTAVVTLVGLLMQRPLRVALQAGFVLSQIGEFSFVLSETAFEARILDEQVYYLLVAVSVATLLLSPYLIAISPGLAGWISERAGGARREDRLAGAAQGHVIVVGYGPAGQSVVRLLMDRGTAVTVIDLNPANLQDQPGLRMRFGDAARPEILDHAGISAALSLVVTIPDPLSARLVIVTARRLAPHIPILVRSRYHMYADQLRAAGATECADEEEEIGTLLAQMTENTLQRKSA